MKNKYAKIAWAIDVLKILDKSDVNRETINEARDIVNAHANSLEKWIKDTGLTSGSVYKTVSNHVLELRRMAR